MNIAKGFHNFEKDLLGKKAVRKIDKFENKAEKYITSKKGLSKDLIKYAVPATTGFIGSTLGALGGGPAGAIAGSAIGSKLGSELLVPKLNKIAGYKIGGKVKKTGLAYIHKDEYILPKGIKPTKTQQKAVAKLHKVSAK